MCHLTYSRLLLVPVSHSRSGLQAWLPVIPGFQEPGDPDVHVKSLILRCVKKKKTGWHRNNKTYLWVGSKPSHCHFAASAGDNFCRNPRGSMLVNIALATVREKPQWLYTEVYFSFT